MLNNYDFNHTENNNEMDTGRNAASARFPAGVCPSISLRTDSAALLRFLAQPRSKLT